MLLRRLTESILVRKWRACLDRRSFFNAVITTLGYFNDMLIANSTPPHPIRQRLHVLPDTKDQLFAENQKDLFSAHSRGYLEAFDQVGRTGAHRGALQGAAVSGVVGGLAIAGSIALTSGSLATAALGGILGSAIGVTLGAIIYPAAVNGARAEAQDAFVKSHPAPYLQVGGQEWLTADGHLVSDVNGQTRGRLPELITA